jgi:hypothetical protein
MISVFAPLRAVVLTLFSVLAIKLAAANYMMAAALLLFFLGFNGLLSCSACDIDRLYHPHKPLPSGQAGMLDSFRISLFLLLFAILTSMYTGGLVPMVALTLFAVGATAIRVNFSFISHLMEAFTLFFAMLVPSFTTNSFIYNFPLAWVVGLTYLSMHISHSLERPFGFENYNLPKIMGVENAKNAFGLLTFLNMVWGLAPMVLMSMGYVLFYPFCMSLQVCAAYLTFTGRHKEAGRVLYWSQFFYLGAIFLL